MAVMSHWCVLTLFFISVSAGTSTAYLDVEDWSYGRYDVGHPFAERQKRSWSRSQHVWRSILKGAQLLRNNRRVMLYQKVGTLDDAIHDFNSLDPSTVHLQNPTTIGDSNGIFSRNGMFLRGRLPNDPDSFQALLIVPSKSDAQARELHNPFRISKGIQYVSPE